MTTPTLPRIALTPGEPAGIGPEIVAALAATDFPADLIAIGDPQTLLNAADSRGIALRLESFDGKPISQRTAGTLRCIDIPLATPAIPGRLDVRNAASVIAMLSCAADGCSAGAFDAVVTAPVQKSILNDAGIAFSGHTEFFAERAHCDVVMMLVARSDDRRARDLRVALATTHLPLSAVPAAITRAGLERTMRILHGDLVSHFGIASPHIAVLGLNPHAGEGGHLGREEIDVIAPTIAKLRAEGFDLLGPIPADTAFLPSQLEHFDAVLAMYHDQGLPVLKHAGFGQSVNITLGLPYIRTSVDHGTALDLAGTGRADASSMITAAEFALDLIHRSAAAKR